MDALDTFGRPLRDLRISVTDRCNFRCVYCMPKEVFGKDFQFLRRDELLTFEEIERLARVFAELGVAKLRITGGEPLVRRDLDRLIGSLATVPGITQGPRELFGASADFLAGRWSTLVTDEAALRAAPDVRRLMP